MEVRAQAGLTKAEQLAAGRVLAASQPVEQIVVWGRHRVSRCS
jgi:hypothetical protein